MARNETNWAVRFRNAFERHPIIVVISIIVIAISQFTTIIKGVNSFSKYYSSTYGWRSEEQATINQLSAAISISKFQEMLGAPLFLRKSGVYEEYVFKRQGYWVQAITDNQGAVALYAVTSCDDTFKPLIRNNPAGKSIQLRETTFKEVYDGGEPELHYFVSGATANSYLIEEAYLANPGNYQTIFWGYNDACSNEWDEEIGLAELGSYLMEHGSRIDTKQSVIDNFRSRNTFNTFAVSAPLVDAREILNQFQIGIDRIQVRVYQSVE